MEENKFGKRFRNKEIQLLKWMDAKGSEGLGLPYHTTLGNAGLFHTPHLMELFPRIC